MTNRTDINPLEVDALVIAREFHVGRSQAADMYADVFSHGCTYEREIARPGESAYVVKLSSNGIEYADA